MRILVFTEGTATRHHSREQFYDVPTFVPTEAAVEKLTKWQQQGAEICYLTSQRQDVMQRQGGGAIVNIASANALVAVSAHAAYSAAKDGVVSLTRQLALDYGPDNIRVNCICPTTTDTPMVRAATDERALREIAEKHPLRRIAKPEDIAYAILFLAYDEARCITGVLLPVDAGWTAQ